MAGDLIKMSTKEIDRLEVIQKVDCKLLSAKQAGDLLGITKRQVNRIIKKYRHYGVAGIVSQRRSKPSNHKHTKLFKQKTLDLIILNYRDFGPTLASEKLMELHEIRVSDETCRLWMMEAGLWQVKSKKRKAIHQQRARRTCFGELIQIDGSPHDWFEGRAPKCCLLVFIDDATSRLTALLFVKAETTLGYFSAIKNHLNRYGRPLSFYNDKHGIFRVNHSEAISGTGETQFGRAMRELGIEVICANTPQAKGRVERVNGILQDRLVKELRLKGINDMETANAFLPSFMETYNDRFGVEAKSTIDAHRKEIPTTEILSLILTKQTERILSKNLELSYDNQIYQIKTQGQGYGLRKARIKICDDGQGNITLIRKDKILDYSELEKAKRSPARIVTSKELSVTDLSKTDGRSKGHKPNQTHPWKTYSTIATGKEAVCGLR